jgi:FAD/FMN-containing dehydrogenase
MDALLAELTAIAGAEHVLTHPDLVAGYTTDWTRRFRGVARGVVRPGDAAQVAQVLLACVRHGTPVVPQGGNTGLAGGGVPGISPAPGAVVLRSRYSRASVMSGRRSPRDAAVVAVGGRDRDDACRQVRSGPGWPA